MKKLLAALVITLSTAALAQSNANTQQESQTKKHVSTGVDASEVAPSASGSKATKEHKQQEEASAMKKEKEHAFNLSGDLKSSKKDEVTLSRQKEGLPDAQLAVRDQTIVRLDGKTVSAADIPEGSMVRAKFQIEGDNAIAVELDASTPKSVAGGAKKGTKSTKETKHAPAPTGTTPAPTEGTQGTHQGTPSTQPTPQQ
ncbi:hypothetical protein [Vitiosangium sp. GDMCC 1.1324]|uniref:hypothetical protein n=1 Tax=Vitiosangium sp. (strain GDMCC 1.1324) TaxID=2138576 RepID=UPI000D397AC5|nr:hypothetical protein [Vitiosangium sp. GDMCC 1.1324]PTL83226.1 hypothetical protein DAT35_14620 [Vitiosangium sp. GDMCC 1.1324]